jgi:hypothetical protein
MWLEGLVLPDLPATRDIRAIRGLQVAGRGIQAIRAIRARRGQIQASQGLLGPWVQPATQGPREVAQDTPGIRGIPAPSDRRVTRGLLAEAPATQAIQAILVTLAMDQRVTRVPKALRVRRATRAIRALLAQLHLQGRLDIQDLSVLPDILGLRARRRIQDRPDILALLGTPGQSSTGKARGAAVRRTS